MYGNGRAALADAMDICASELEMLIDRHFAAKRELVLEREGNHWVASIGDTVLFRSSWPATMRFAVAFAQKNPNVTVTHAEDWTDAQDHSVRVDNVVPILGGAA